MSEVIERIGPYEVKGELGRGGMGVVLLARDPRLQREVAIKLLPSDLASDEAIRTRFVSEARSAGRLQHPHIVPVYDVGEHDGRPFIVMQRIEGVELADWLRDRGRLAPAEAVPLLRQIADAIDHAHAHGVVHRDIKPENILVDRRGEALLTDFGIARAADSGGRGLTRTGMVLGTPEYMSPEQALGAAIDHRSDLYSFGVVAYRMLCGSVPFSGESLISVAMKHVDATPPDPLTLAPELGPGIAASLKLMLAKDPGQRYASATAFVDALAAGTETRSPAAARAPTVALPAATVAAPTAPPPARNAGMGLLAAALVLGVAMVTSAVLLQRPAAPVAVVPPPGDQEAIPEPPPPPEPPPEPLRLRVANATASSVLEDDYKRYNPMKVTDSDTSTAWNAANRRRGSSGSGEWIELDLGEPMVIHRIAVCPGYGHQDYQRKDTGQTVDLFFANNSVKAARVDLDGETILQLSFDREATKREFKVSPPRTGRRLRLSVQAAYRGQPFGDLGVSEIEVYGFGPGGTE